MKKKLRFFLIVFLLPCLAMAQRHSQSQTTIKLNGNSIDLPDNFQNIRKGFKKKSPLEGHFIIQFNSIPTLSEQNQLNEQGITLLDYLHGKAYFVSVSSRFYSISKSGSKNIRSLVEIKPEYKIQQDLARGDIPKHAKTGNGFVKVVIGYFEDTDESVISSDLSQLKISDFRVLSDFNQVTASVAITNVSQIASLEWVQNIEPIDPPSELHNDHGKTLHRANVLNSNIRGLGYGLTGKGVKIGLWDADVYNHRDFNDRVTVREFEMHNTDHGTHTCGTITGSGLIDPKAQGMAPDALIYSWNFNTQSNGFTDQQEKRMSVVEDGIEITSNSYGIRVSSCPNPHPYYPSDRNDDLLALDYPYFLYVFSVGNDQARCPDGYSTTSKNLKNSLMVAAIDQLDNMSSFSSFGPSKDGRLIPNISGDGVNTYSNFFDNGYDYMSGTSMATPGVAGTMALVYQRYKDTHGDERPTSALMRALACNTAYDLGNPGPDFKYGYGEINGLRAVEVMEQNNYFTDTVSQGTNIEEDIAVPEGAVALRVMLAWTDQPASYGASKILINDLNLSVSNGGTTVLPWVLDPGNPSTDAVRAIDNMNNLEQVTIANPASGIYTIRIDGSVIPQGTQEFAVVYDIVMPTLKLTYPIGGEYISPNSQTVIRWDCEGYDNTFTLEYSADSGVNYTVIASNIPSDKRSYLTDTPAEVTKNGKIRITNGSVLNISKETFHIMDVPQNVNVASAQCGGAGPFIMQWDAVTNAKYEVLKLNGQVYEHLAEVTGNSYNITNITQNKNNWYCIRAIDLTTGAISERSLAVTVNPAVAVVSLPFSEKFESQKATNFYFAGIKGQGNVRYVNDSQKYGIRLEGTSGATTDWVDATDTACFSNNPDYVVSAGICNIDATSMAGKVFRLKFDYRQKFRSAVGTSYFMVKVNGDTLTNSEGNKIYGATSQVSYKSVYYDLTAYAGLASVTVEFEAVCKTNYTTYINPSGNYDFSNDTYDVGDFVTIDNIEIFEPFNDLSLNSLDIGEYTDSETITIIVQNHSGSMVSDIPVSYSINGGAAVIDTIPGPIAPMAELSYPFTQLADFSVGGQYVVTATINWPSDSDDGNNTVIETKTNNGDDILLGTGNPTSTCNGTFTDPEGQYFNYANSYNYVPHTIFPDTPGKNVKVTFTEFALEADFDYLYIYDGTDYYAPYLGRYTGNTLPASFTSTSHNGELTFYFYSDGLFNDKGFVATLECVDKPAAEPALIAITAPVSGANLSGTETVTITLKNNGIQDLIDVDVYYQVDELLSVHEVVPALDSLQELSYSFAATADLSTVDTFKIKTWVDFAGDVDMTNNVDSVYIINSAVTIDAGISTSYAIRPLRAGSSAIDVEITNYGNQTISNFDIAYTINNGAEVTQTVVGQINAGASLDTTFITLADLTTAGTTYTIKVYTKLAGDILANNDSISSVVVTPTIAATNVVGSFIAGTSNVVIAGTSPSVDLTNDYTIECWVNLGAPATFGHIFNKTNVSLWYQTGAGSYYYGDNSFILYGIKEHASDSIFMMFVPNALNLGNWQHIALTVSAGNVYTLYLDGVAQTWTPYSGTAGATKTNANMPLYIGNRATDLARSANGFIDEVRIWNSALDQPAISANMMTDYAVNTAGMLAYYKFKEGDGNYVYDYSSNDNTAIVSNADVSGMGEGKFWNVPGLFLKDLNITGEKIPTTFNANTNTFSTIMDGVALNSLIANFTAVQQSVIKVGGVVQATGVTTNDYSSPVAYLAEGFGFNTGINQNYTVSVVNDLSSDCDLTAYTFEMADNSGLSEQIVLVQNGNNYYKKLAYGTDVSALKAGFTVSASATVYINDVVQTSPQAATFDYSEPVIVKVLAENGRDFKNYSIFLDTRNTAADLTAFNIVEEQVGTTDLDGTGHTADVWVKNNSNVLALLSTYTVSPMASVYVNNVPQLSGLTTNDFTNPLIYTVVSEDESTEVDWTATVTKDMTKPVITLIGDDSVNVFIGETYVDAGATATDNVDGDLTSSIEVTDNINTNVLGVDTVWYNLVDAAGNEADEIIRKVNVQVKLVASIVVTGTNSATTITVNGDSLQMIAEVLPADATDSHVTWSVQNGTGEATISATGMLKAGKDGTVTVTATANDESGITGPLVITISNQGTFVFSDGSTFLSISPNPAKDKIKIETNEDWNNLIIYNSIGVVMKKSSYIDLVDISDLPEGLYLIKIFNKNGKPYPVKEFIKQ